MNPLVIGGAAAAAVYMLTRGKSDDGTSGDPGGAKSDPGAKVPDPATPLPNNTGTAATSEIISKLKQGEEPLKKEDEASQAIVDSILKTLGMKNPLKNINSRSELQAFITDYTSELEKDVLAIKGFDFAGDANTPCISQFMTWKGNINFLPKYGADNPLKKGEKIFLVGTSAFNWAQVVRDHFFSDGDHSAKGLTHQLFLNEMTEIPVEYSYSAPINGTVKNGAGEIIFSKCGRKSPYNVVTVVEDDSFRFIKSLITSPAEIYAEMSAHIKEVAFSAVDGILAHNLSPETTLAALFAWLVGWSETFGAFDLRQPTEAQAMHCGLMQADAPTYCKVPVGGYDILRYMQEKTNDDGDAFLFRQFSRYAAMFRHISFKAFCLANKETGKAMIDCLTDDDLKSNPNLDALLKEMGQ